MLDLRKSLDVRPRAVSAAYTIAPTVSRDCNLYIAMYTVSRAFDDPE